MRRNKGNLLLLLIAIVVLSWNNGAFCQDDATRLELMPSQAVQEKAVNSNSVFTCVPRGAASSEVKNLRWLDPKEKIVPPESDSRIYTETLQDHSLMLIIKNTARGDGGIYKCLADVDGQPLETSFELKPYIDITWIDVPRTQHPVADTEDLIKCEVSADPPATINWSKDGHVYKPGDRCKIEQNGIRCFPILETDNGSYSCRAVVSSTGRVDERPINVEVYVKPAIEGAQEIYEAIEDNAMTLTCNAQGKPVPEYTWLDKNNENLKDRADYLINVADGIGTLKINRVSREDSGTITCVAKNVAGEDKAEMRVQVIVKPKIIKFDSKSIAEGSTVNLQCYVQAEPRPTVEFQKIGTDQIYTVDTESDDKRIKVFSGSEREDSPSNAVQIYTLEINGIIREDDGDYRCLAKNTGGNVDTNAHLEVEYVPTFVNVTSEVLSWINNPVSLSCQSSAIPNATVSWWSKNVDLANNPNVKIEGSHQKSILTITPVDNGYFGIYECRAKNKLGQKNHEFTLKEASVPDKIMQVNFIHKTATTITIGLHGPKNDGGFPVESFIVEYWREGSEGSDANTKQRIWPISSNYILEKLEPETTYFFRFAAVNRVGTGPFTPEEQHRMPKKAAPEEPQILNDEEGLIINSLHPNMYTIEWEVPHDNGEKISHFEITYYPVKKDGAEFIHLGNMITKTVPHPGKTQFNVEDLEPGTLYKVEIRAHNEIGYSQPAIVVFKTPDDETQTVSTTLEINDGNVQPQLTMSNFPMEIIIVIAVVAVVFIIIVIDVTCYVTNKCGILMCLCVHMCNKQVPSDKVKEAHMEEGKTKDSKTEKEQEVKRSAIVNDTNMAKDSVV